MADSIKLTTLTASIAALTITVTNARGSSVTLNIDDLSGLQKRVKVNQQDCPLLMPRPDNFVTDFSVMRDTMGADAALKTAAYTLNYIFYYSPIAQGVGIFEKYDEMVTAAAVILNHLATNTALSGSTDILPASVPAFGAMPDATGTLFHGCEIALRVMQYMET